MEEQATYITKEHRFTRTEVLEELRKVIAEKNARHGFDGMFYQDHLALQLTTDAFARLINQRKEALTVASRNTLTLENC